MPYRYAVCAGTLRTVSLPAAAEDLLRDKLRTFDVGGPDQGRKEECFDVTREEARTLEEILLSDGWFRIEKAYGFHELADADDLILVATFCPIFPHGTFVGRPG